MDDEDWVDKKDELSIICRKELVKYDNFSFEDMFSGKDINKKVDELFPMDKIKDTFIPVREHAEKFISFFRKTFLDNLLSPIIESIESIKTEEINKDQEKETIEKELRVLKDKNEHIEKQLEELRLDIKTLLA